MSQAATRVGLRWIDGQLRVEHCYLEPADSCCYLWDYRPGRSRAGCEGIICDLKRRPSEVSRSEVSRRVKLTALDRAASALRQAVPRAWAEDASWCPIPPSGGSNDGEYDDRLACILRTAFEGYDVDIRCLLSQVQSTRPDHWCTRRLSFESLYSLMRVDHTALSQRAVRGHLVLFDDLLTTGKHFKCAQRHLREEAGAGLRITACVLARRVLAPSRLGRRGFFRRSPP